MDARTLRPLKLSVLASGMYSLSSQSWVRRRFCWFFPQASGSKAAQAPVLRAGGMSRSKRWRSLPARLNPVFLSLFVLGLAACGGGGGGGSSDVPPSLAPPPAPAPAPEPPASSIFESPESVSRFLAFASFGATPEDLDTLVGTSASAWFLDQLDASPSNTLPLISDYLDATTDEAQEGFFRYIVPALTFWRIAIDGEDQLRQRMAFALSQIMVLSDFSADLIADQPQSMGYYRDILTEHALGNFRDLLEDVTYSPAMSYYLTYLGNLPADPETGRQPDENYAREIMQLFTIGLVELNDDGTPRLDGNGDAIETYDSDDIDGLARVFTGMDIDSNNYWEDPESLARPLYIDEYRHSKREKRFLTTVIPEETPGPESISRALDALFDHPNVGPFIGRQLIQRFTTSDPSPAYTQRVATAFNSGEFILPNDARVGTGERGDLAATIAAVLFDSEARRQTALENPRFGKPREPVLRFTQWARAFGVDGTAPELNPILYDTSSTDALAQHPYRSRSVFNFYRPGYVAPGTDSGALGMTVPELQIVNASSTPGYVNFMAYFAFREPRRGESDDFLRDYFGGSDLAFNIEERARESFVPGYERELAVADDPVALVDRLDTVLANGALEEGTREAIVDLVSELPLERQDWQIEGDDGRHLRVYFAVLMTMAAPEYLVQQ